MRQELPLTSREARSKTNRVSAGLLSVTPGITPLHSHSAGLTELSTLFLKLSEVEHTLKYSVA